MPVLPTETELPVIERQDARCVFRNRYAQVFNDAVVFPDGRSGRYVRVIAGDGRPGAVVLPVSGEHIGLVHVYRYALRAWEWGLPRGMAQSTDPQDTARLELIEELGVVADQLVSLGEVTPDSGILDQVVHMYLAFCPVQSRVTLDPGEVRGISWIPVPDLLRAIASGEIRDGFTLAALCRALCRGLLH